MYNVGAYYIINRYTNSEPAESVACSQTFDIL